MFFLNLFATSMMIPSEVYDDTFFAQSFSDAQWMQCTALDKLNWVTIQISNDLLSLSNNRMGTDVLGPGGIWGRVQGVGSDHWGTRSQP